MAHVRAVRPRIFILLGITTAIAICMVIAVFQSSYWSIYSDDGTFRGSSLSRVAITENRLLDKLAIILPVNNNTDMQFYRNMWIRDYLYPVCDWPGPNCRIVCHRDSTYRTLDQKTQCFARAVKKFKAKEYFIKLDDDALVDKDYIIDLVKKLSGYKRPAYISDHRIFRDPWNLQSLDRVPYGNGKFYMFNRQLVKCLNTSMTYIGPRNEDAVFGGMVSTGCGTSNVAYIRENDAWIWHKEYASKNKHIDLAFIKNH